MDQSKTNTTTHPSATLPTGNNKYTRPGPGEVEEEIRLLDSSASSGGQGDREGPVGRADGIPRPGQLAEREHGEAGGIEPELFFVDVGAHATWEPNGIYVRASEAILGDEEDLDSPLLNLGPSCFNCGEPDHIVAACRQRVNRELVALSRQFYTFLKTARGAVDFKRIHEVEAWRQQRLEWLDTFQPGEIRGPTLREALGGEDGDWLANMGLWGYPGGWVNVEDPREKVKQLIWNDNCDGEDDEPEAFFIFGDNNNAEAVYSSGESRTLSNKEDGDGDGDEESTLDSTSTASSNSSPSPTKPIRWATYPPSHFSSQLLPTYNGYALPPINGHQGSATYTTDRHALWQRIVSGTNPTQPLPPSRWTSSDPPPPPITEPPPIPPPPPLVPPPPLPMSPSPPPPSLPPEPPLPRPLPVYNPENDEEIDMDMSD